MQRKINLKTLAADLEEYIREDVESMKNDPSYAEATPYIEKLNQLRERLKDVQTILSYKYEIVPELPEPTEFQLPPTPSWITEELGEEPKLRVFDVGVHFLQTSINKAVIRVYADSPERACKLAQAEAEHTCDEIDWESGDVISNGDIEAGSYIEVTV